MACPGPAASSWPAWLAWQSCRLRLPPGPRASRKASTRTGSSGSGRTTRGYTALVTAVQPGSSVIQRGDVVPMRA